MHTWVKGKLNQIIKEEINLDKNAMCPYGGMMLVDLLKKAYGKNVMILDNGNEFKNKYERHDININFCKCQK